MVNHDSEYTPLTLARISGVLYMIIIICAGFSQGFVRGSLVVSNDATSTAHNILTSQGLFRVGLVSDLIAFLCDAVVAILLYILLRPVGKTLSLIAATFRLLAHPAIAGINLVNHHTAIHILLNDSYLNSFSQSQLYSLSLLFMDIHKYGYLIAGAFFAIHLLLLGYLIVKSELFPGWLGVLIFLASFGYLIETIGDFLVPGHEAIFAWIVGISAAIGEVTLCIYLLTKGVRQKSQLVNSKK